MLNCQTCVNGLAPLSRGLIIYAVEITNLKRICFHCCISRGKSMLRVEKLVHFSNISEKNKTNQKTEI